MAESKMVKYLLEEIGQLDAGEFEELLKGMAEIVGNVNEHNREDPDMAWERAKGKLLQAVIHVRARSGN